MPVLIALTQTRGYLYKPNGNHICGPCRDEIVDSEPQAKAQFVRLTKALLRQAFIKDSPFYRQAYSYCSQCCDKIKPKA